MAEKEMYDIAYKSKTPQPLAVEIATVVSPDPLTIKIGETVYSSEHWLMYEAYREFDGEITLFELGFTNLYAHRHLDSVPQHSDAQQVKSSTGRIKIQIGETIYHPGDLLAVQELKGKKTFIILTKIRGVV